MQKSDKYVGRGHYLDAGVKIAEVKLVWNVDHTYTYLVKKSEANLPVDLCDDVGIEVKEQGWAVMSQESVFKFD
jgi:hypothetical protein